LTQTYSPGYQPLIIIGPARSGTRLVRDWVARHPLIDKVPYDINYIWRLGNESVPHDELEPHMLDSKKVNRIRRAIESYRGKGPFLIEKTVSNCLRVPFVDAILPNARYIMLLRDGWDVIESTYRQWLAPPEWNYIFKKMLKFPLSQAPGYAFRYAIQTLAKMFGTRSSQNSTWGPRYRGIDQDVASKKLIEVCAIQWQLSVEKSHAALEALPVQRLMKIRYEDFVDDPIEQLAGVANYLGIDPEPYYKMTDLSQVSRNNIGKGKRQLTEEDLSLIGPIIKETMLELGKER